MKNKANLKDSVKDLRRKITSMHLEVNSIFTELREESKKKNPVEQVHFQMLAMNLRHFSAEITKTIRTIDERSKFL